MLKNRTHKIVSLLLFAAYLNLIALTVFHFHAYSFINQPASITGAGAVSKIIDPFSDGNSNCSVTQFSSSSYINEKDFCSSKTLINNCDYSSFTLSNKPLQLIFSANSLRAPPFAS
jgi:hypothetical protein